ncbi:hypothetical protein IK146_00410 [Candidatus Saccharibacteria bacterium]|nr:hypothetical protein [Candidatus Saccharibacteria bacterium]
MSSIYTDIIDRGNNFKNQLTSQWTTFNNSVAGALSTLETAIGQITIDHNHSVHLEKDVDEGARDSKARRQIDEAKKAAKDKAIQAAKALIAALEES